MEKSGFENIPNIDRENYWSDKQSEYGQNPYSEHDNYHEVMSGEAYSSMMQEVFERVGLIREMRERTLTILASSVSGGDRDYKFIKDLDKRASIENLEAPKILLTDFALDSEKKPIVKKTDHEMSNLSVQSIAADSFDLPLHDQSVDVIYERLGALWHAAELDFEILRKRQSYEKANRGLEEIKRILQEYRRSLVEGGVVILDWKHMEPLYSTVSMINDNLARRRVWPTKKTPGDRMVDFMQEQGFEVGFVDLSEEPRTMWGKMKRNLMEDPGTGRAFMILKKIVSEGSTNSS